MNDLDFGEEDFPGTVRLALPQEGPGPKWVAYVPGGRPKRFHNYNRAWRWLVSLKKKRGQGQRARQGESTRPLTILSNGLGRDSMTILALLMEGKCLVNGRKTRLSEIDAVVFSDTGAEWQSTMQLIPQVQQICSKAGVPFFWLRKPSFKEMEAFEVKFERQKQKVLKRAGMPYKGRYPFKGAPELQGLRAGLPWRTRNYKSIDEKASGGGYHKRIQIEREFALLDRLPTKSSKECTVVHKIEPIRELLDDLLQLKRGMTLAQWGLAVKSGFLEPNNMILGIAADESHRARPWKPNPKAQVRGGGGVQEPLQRWGVRDVYPLVEAKIGKDQEGKILKRHGWGEVRKSGCTSCPHQGWAWYWVLKRRDPKRFADAVFMETKSLETRTRYSDARKRAKERLGLMYLRGEKPIAQEVSHKSKSRLAFWDMHRKGKIPPAFVRTIQKTVDPNWPGKDSDLSLSQLPEAMKREMEEIILAKGYGRSCGFGRD